MIIKSNGEITQTIEMNGTTVTVTGTILEVQNDSMRCESGGCEFNLGIELSEDTLTTTFPIGTCGSNYTEIDVWKKQTAASIQMEGLNQQLLLDNDEVEAIPGGGFGGLYKYLP
jgi:hypothetical protein